MKSITLNVEKIGKTIQVHVHYPELDPTDRESIFCEMMKPCLYEFLKQLPVAKMVGYASAESPGEAQAQATLMAELNMAMLEDKEDE